MAVLPPAHAWLRTVENDCKPLGFGSVHIASRMIGAVGDVLSTLQRSSVEFAPGDDDDDE